VRAHLVLPHVSVKVLHTHTPTPTPTLTPTHTHPHTHTHKHAHLVAACEREGAAAGRERDAIALGVELGRVRAPAQGRVMGACGHLRCPWTLLDPPSPPWPCCPTWSPSHAQAHAGHWGHSWSMESCRPHKVGSTLLPFARPHMRRLMTAYSARGH